VEKLGRRHPELRRLRALRRDRAERERLGLFLAEGVHLAQEALTCDAPVERVLVAPRLERTDEGRELLRAIAERGLPTAEISDTSMDALQDVRTPQPVLMVVRRSVRSIEELLSSVDRPLVVIGHGIQDPGNLGSMLRTADAAGADAFCACGGAVDPYHPRAVRGSMGSVFRLAPLTADTEVLLDLLAHRGIATVATSPTAATSLVESDLRPPCALLFGSEGAGLPAGVARRIERNVRIPMRSGVESLSVGAAAAVLLFEAARQRDS